MKKSIVNVLHFAWLVLPLSADADLLQTTFSGFSAHPTSPAGIFAPNEPLTVRLILDPTQDQPWYPFHPDWEYTSVLNAEVLSYLGGFNQFVSFKQGGLVTVYADSTPDADYSNSATFTDGVNILEGAVNNMAGSRININGLPWNVNGDITFTDGAGIEDLLGCASGLLMNDFMTWQLPNGQPLPGIPPGYKEAYDAEWKCKFNPCDGFEPVLAIPPTNAYPIVYSEDGRLFVESRHDHSINPIASEGMGLTLDFSLDQLNCLCFGGSQAADSVAFVMLPDSTLDPTGRVFDVDISPAYSGARPTYFLIDNFTAPGDYYLRAACGGYGYQYTPTNFTYLGYQGYESDGNLFNGGGAQSDRGGESPRIIRGADVSIWNVAGGPPKEVDRIVATDGTYSFDVPPGTYDILVEFELGAEQWRGPFEVVDGVPYQDLLLTPITDDDEAPLYSVVGRSSGAVSGKYVDGIVGISVVEIIPGSARGVQVLVEPFDNGANEVGFDAILIDPQKPGSVMMQAIDQLGNATNTRVIIPTSVTGDVPERGRALSPLRISRVSSAEGSREHQIDLVADREIHGAVAVYDVGGRLVRVIHRGQYIEGRNRMTWNETDSDEQRVSSGIYFIRALADGSADTQKVIVLR